MKRGEIQTLKSTLRSILGGSSDPPSHKIPLNGKKQEIILPCFLKGMCTQKYLRILAG